MSNIFNPWNKKDSLIERELSVTQKVAQPEQPQPKLPTQIQLNAQPALVQMIEKNMPIVESITGLSRKEISMVLLKQAVKGQFNLEGILGSLGGSQRKQTRFQMGMDALKLIWLLGASTAIFWLVFLVLRKWMGV